MASRSSQLKNGMLIDRKHANLLLEDGAWLDEPTPQLAGAAELLHAHGLITFGVCEYVKCVEPCDRDFPPRNRHCTGRILLTEGQDEDADDIRCPECERPVRPHSLGKLKHHALQPTLQREGALAWIRNQLEGVSDDVRDLGDGNYQVGGFGDLGVGVCVVDADGRADGRWNKRDVAARNPVVYVTLNPKIAEGRFIRDDWLHRVSLLDLVCGAADLQTVLTDCSAAGPAKTLTAVDVPVYAKGHVLVQPEEPPHTDRLFVVELDDDVMRINGEVVINPQGKPRLALFSILWHQFLVDVSKHNTVDEFTAVNMRKLLEAMKVAGHPYTSDTSLRKLINNLQADIETLVKRKLGIPISREDVVQTCHMQSQADTSGGYRINPYTVAIRPCQSR